MIDFRYHIVSITAVFLALGIGVAVGATVLDRVTVAGLEGTVNRLSEQADSQRADIADLRDRLGAAEDLNRGLAARVTASALADRQVIFIDQSRGASWSANVRRRLREAGAADLGSLEFTPEWGRRSAVRALGDLFSEAGVDVPQTQTVDSFMRALGEHVGDVVGQELFRVLGEAGYLHTDMRGDGTFTSPGAVVVLTSGDGAAPASQRVASFAEGAAGSVATTVVSGRPDGLGSVGPLRKASGLPPELTTFDSAADDDTGVATVLALRAAIDSRGGHFGNGSGLSYFPPV